MPCHRGCSTMDIVHRSMADNTVQLAHGKACKTLTRHCWEC